MHSYVMIFLYYLYLFSIYFVLFIPVILHHNLTWLAALYIVVYSFIVCMCYHLILSKWMNAFNYLLLVLVYLLHLSFYVWCSLIQNKGILTLAFFFLISSQLFLSILISLPWAHCSHSSPFSSHFSFTPSHFSSIPLIDFSSIPSHWLLIPFLFPPLKVH